MNTESKEDQYNAYRNNGGTMTMQEWENDGRFDPGYAKESKHTPGPWHISDDWRTGELFIKAGEAKIASVLDTNMIPLDQYKLNAELIASAPQLLEENERLKAVNADLLEATEELTKFIINALSHSELGTDQIKEVLFRPLELIQKAKNEIHTT